MTRLTSLFFFAATILVLPACGNGGADGLTEWQGETPHFQASGFLNNEDIQIVKEGTEAADTSKWSCRREYEIPVDGAGTRDYANGQLVELKIKGELTFNDETRIIEVELKRHDFQSDTVGAVVTIVPRSETQDPAANEMWLEWEWHDAADETTFEGAAQSGTFKLEAFTGTPGADGLVIPDDTGTAGGFIDATWSQTDSLKISFTSNCRSNKIVEIQ